MKELTHKEVSSRGGQATRRNTTAERRHELAQAAAVARWARIPDEKTRLAATAPAREAAAKKRKGNHER